MKTHLCAKCSRKHCNALTNHVKVNSSLLIIECANFEPSYQYGVTTSKDSTKRVTNILVILLITVLIIWFILAVSLW